MGEKALPIAKKYRLVKIRLKSLKNVIFTESKQWPIKTFLGVFPIWVQKSVFSLFVLDSLSHGVRVMVLDVNYLRKETDL